MWIDCFLCSCTWNPCSGDLALLRRISGNVFFCSGDLWVWFSLLIQLFCGFSKLLAPVLPCSGETPSSTLFLDPLVFYLWFRFSFDFWKIEAFRGVWFEVGWFCSKLFRFEVGSLQRRENKIFQKKCEARSLNKFP